MKVRAPSTHHGHTPTSGTLLLTLPSQRWDACLEKRFQFELVLTYSLRNSSRQERRARDINLARRLSGCHAEEKDAQLANGVNLHIDCKVS